LQSKWNHPISVLSEAHVNGVKIFFSNYHEKFFIENWDFAWISSLFLEFIFISLLLLFTNPYNVCLFVKFYLFYLASINVILFALWWIFISMSLLYVFFSMNIRPCVRRNFPNFSFSRVSEMFSCRSSDSEIFQKKMEFLNPRKFREKVLKKVRKFKFGKSSDIIRKCMSITKISNKTT